MRRCSSLAKGLVATSMALALTRPPLGSAMAAGDGQGPVVIACGGWFEAACSARVDPAKKDLTPEPISSNSSGTVSGPEAPGKDNHPKVQVPRHVAGGSTLHSSHARKAPTPLPRPANATASTAMPIPTTEGPSPAGQSPQIGASSAETPPAAPSHPTSATPSHPLVIDDNNKQQIRDCAGAAISVVGNANRLVLTGYCRSISVSGSDNQVVAELEDNGELSVQGAGNTVAWSSPNAVSSVRVGAGRTNKTIHLANKPASEEETLLKTSDGMSGSTADVESSVTAPIVHDCASTNLPDAARSEAYVTAVGSNHGYIFSGGCHAVTILGNNNKVLVEVADDGSVTAVGDNNEVVWSRTGFGSNPIVTTIGNFNSSYQIAPANMAANVSEQFSEAREAKP